MNKTICIIGSGPSGLVSCKSALECGVLQPTVYEKSGQLGGVWAPSKGLAWDNMRTNLSYFSCMFSDYHWGTDINVPANDHLFPTRHELYNYLDSYANHFKLKQHIQFNSTITNIKKIDQKWRVAWVKEGVEGESLYDYVIVASGIFAEPSSLKIDGLEEFKSVGGRVSHSGDYKNPTNFKDKKVAIVGGNHSGCEIGVDMVSGGSGQVTVVTRHKTWYLPRHFKQPGNPDAPVHPIDIQFFSRAGYDRSKFLEVKEAYKVKNEFFAKLVPSQQEVQEIRNDSSLESPPFATITDRFIELVAKKHIRVVSARLASIKGKTLIFDDGSSLDDVDELVDCTGYRLSLSFLDSQVQQHLSYKPTDQFQPVLLHKTVWPSGVEGLAFVGIYKGPYFSVLELQARWACMVFSGILTPPSQEDIQKGVEEELRIRNQVPRAQWPHGDYVRFVDDLASEVKVLPDFDKLKDQDPKLHKLVYNNFISPCSFRLVGDDPVKKSKSLQHLEYINNKFYNYQQVQSETVADKRERVQPEIVADKQVANSK